jgi:hypothetical protein
MSEDKLDHGGVSGDPDAPDAKLPDYVEGYQDGYEHAVNVPETNSQEDADYDEGYEDGRADGYTEGRQDAEYVGPPPEFTVTLNIDVGDEQLSDRYGGYDPDDLTEEDMLAHVDMAASHFKEKISLWYKQRNEVAYSFNELGQLWDRIEREEAEEQADYTRVVPGGEGG